MRIRLFCLIRIWVYKIGSGYCYNYYGSVSGYLGLVWSWIRKRSGSDAAIKILFVDSDILVGSGSGFMNKLGHDLI